MKRTELHCIHPTLIRGCPVISRFAHYGFHFIYLPKLKKKEPFRKRKNYSCCLVFVGIKNKVSSS